MLKRRVGLNLVQKYNKVSEILGVWSVYYPVAKADSVSVNDVVLAELECRLVKLILVKLVERSGNLICPGVR